jgi:hypothetical protein
MKRMEASTHIPLSEDAALVAALAGTAMAFSHCAEDEAERWIRALRLHGGAGSVLQALGVGEAPLERVDDLCTGAGPQPPLGQQALDSAIRRAEELAGARGSETITTTDLLVALFDVYGENIDVALQARGSSRREVLDRLDEARDSAEAPNGPPPV